MAQNECGCDATNTIDVAINNSATYWQGQGFLLSNSVAATTDQFVCVKNGMLDIDFTTNYIFAAGSKIIFLDETSGMNIDNGKRLIVRGTQIEGCSTMWKTIHVRENSKISLSDNSIVKDGLVALSIEPNTNSRIFSVTFEKNDISIRYNPTSIPNSGLDVAFVRNCTFNGQGPLLNGSAFGRGAIEANEIQLSVLSIGSFSSGQNVIQNYGTTAYTPVGISLTNANAIIENTKFINIGDYHAGLNSIFATVGYGIFASSASLASNNLVIVGLGSDNSTFENIDTAISAIGTNLDIADSKFYNCVYGIDHQVSFVNTNPTTVSIVNNIFYDFKLYSMLITNVPDVTEVIVKDNVCYGHVDLPPPPLFNYSLQAIEIQGISGTSNANVLVENNEIYFNPGNGFTDDRRGISIFSIDNGRVFGNLILNLGGDDLFEGIEAFICPGIIISGNSVVGESVFPYSTRNDAIRVLSCSRANISCNEVDYTNIGVFFSGGCDNTNFGANIMKTHQDGLSLFSSYSSNTVIGNQIGRGNRWFVSSNNNPQLGDPLDGNLNANDWTLSPFKIPTFTSGNDDPANPKWANPRSSQPWFQSAESGEQFCGSGGGGSESTAFSPAQLRVLENQSIDGFRYEDFELMLYMDIVKRSELLNQHPNALVWYNTQTNGNIGLFGSSLMLLENLRSFDLVLNEEIQSRKSKLEDLEKQVHILQVSLSEYSLNENLSEIVRMKGGINAIVSEIDALQIQYNGKINTRVVLIDSLLDNINAVDNWEQNMLVSLRAALKKKKGENLSNSEIAELFQIANRCIGTDGHGVVLARSFFPEIDFEESDNNCGSRSEKGNTETFEKDGDIDVSVYPNPATNRVCFTIETANAEDEFDIVIYNGFGQLEKSIFTTNETYCTEQLNLSPGLYKAIIVRNGQMISQKSFFIVE